jgi:GntR family transcriptional regulator
VDVKYGRTTDVRRDVHTRASFPAVSLREGIATMESSPLRRPALSQQLQEMIDRRIRDGVYPPGSMLPSESDLAQETGLSRATVRTALGVLASDGRIVRRQGVGTLVSKLSLISNPINRFMGFHELIQSGGYMPDVIVRGARIASAQKREAADLSVNEGSLLLVVRKVFTADEVPVVFVDTSMPEWLLRGRMKELLEQPEVTEPLFPFVEGQCGRKVESMAATLWPQTAQGCRAESGIDIAHLDAETPILMMRNIAYGEDDTPLFLSLQAYTSDNMRFNLIRRR